MITDMTVGKSWKVLWRFSLPLLISAIFQQLYNIADSVIAGQYIGENAVAAVGASLPILQIYLAIAFGCNSGVGVIVARLFVAKKANELKSSILTGSVAALGLSIILGIVGIFFAERLLIATNIDPSILEASKLYMIIYLCGLGFVFLYNVGMAAFTALGDSKTPLLFLIGSSVVNVFLDILFVAVFKMGITGVAFATLIAQGGASIITWVVLLQRLKQIPHTQKPKFDLHLLRNEARIGVPTMVQQSFVSIGNIFIYSIINSYGASATAGFSSALRIVLIAIMSFVAFTNGMSNYTAQNIGADKIDRVKGGFIASLSMGFIVAMPFVILNVFFPQYVMRLFIRDETSEAIVMGVNFLRIVSPFYFALVLKIICDGVLKGAGSMKAFMFATFSDLIARVLLAYFLTPYLGLNGIGWAWVVGWMFGSIISLSIYISGHWKKRARRDADALKECTEID